MKLEEINFELTREERVNAGILWLDEVRPNWWQELDLGRLDLGSGCNCVLGQIVSFECSKGEWEVEQEWLTEAAGSGFDQICDVPMDSYQWQALELVDDLINITLSTAQAVNRGFHVSWHRADESQRATIQVTTEFNALTALWYAEVMVRRGA